MISREQLGEVRSWIAERVTSVTLQSDLRRRFPEMHFTFCSDDDVMVDQPISSCEGFNLYLVDTSNHCFSLTGDMQVATGLVVAELEEE